MDPMELKTIYIADDNITDRLILETTLKKLGFRVRAFLNGTDIYNAIYATDTPVIALLDWLMPGRNGVDICKSLSDEPPQQPVYLIVVTSRSEKDDIAFALENGANDFVSKPFNVPELKARVDVGIRFLKLHKQLIDSNSRLLEYTRHVESLAEERAVQLVQADRLSTIGLLSAGMAHEINNPTSFVAINIQTLEENLQSITNALKPGATETELQKAAILIDVIPEILHEMKNGVARIKTIVNGLKTYSHMSQNEHTKFTINDCIESALQLCANKLKYHVTINKEFSSRTPIYGNMGQIEQVFINLLTNAADAIESTGKEGFLHITTEDRGGRVVSVIRDTGPGVPESKIEQVFMPFFTTKPVGKGTGLGLSISKNIINDHKGELLLENHPDGGAVFTVILNAHGEVQS
jgi:signal transduction histidine kinase